MQNQFENHGNGLITFKDVVALISRWRKQLLILGILSFIVSAVISFMLTPKYKSSVVFYPTTNNSISNALLTDLNQRQKDPLEFGEEEEAEKALQILQSSKLTERLIRNYDLMNHYKIDPKSNLKKTKLQNKINSNFSFSRTRYLSIKVDVMDEDPVMAAKMANGILDLYDSIKNEIQLEVAIPALEIVKRQMQAKENEVNNIKTELVRLGNEGVINYEEQSRALSEEIYKARASGRTKELQGLIEQQKNLVQFGGQFTTYTETLQLELDKLSDLKAKYERAEVDVKETLNNKFTVSGADVAEQRAYPVRKLIVLISLICTLSFAIVFFAIYEKMKPQK
ncbi:MAG: Wzz/FepE/Etk N-terminal domain-containing protein [Bacteroidia bacterium]